MKEVTHIFGEPSLQKSPHFEIITSRIQRVTVVSYMFISEFLLKVFFSNTVNSILHYLFELGQSRQNPKLLNAKHT